MTHDERQGLWLGFVGVAIFALTLPMTRLSVGTPQEPLMSGVFVAMGRAAVAGLLSIVFLAVTRAPRPPRRLLPLLAATAAGVVFGFPLLMSIAMRHVEAVHASVILGALPLATAVAGALLHRQRPSSGFWACAALGALLVMAFAVLHAGQGLSLHAADVLLFAAMACGAMGYACGGRLSQTLRADHVICWVLVITLPVTLPLALWTWPSAPQPVAAWIGFGYLALFSQWIGFFAWYRGLALGGTVRVSQVQLVQPFMSMLFAVPLLDERLDLLTAGFALAVIATVFIGKKMPVRATAASISRTPVPEHR